MMAILIILIILIVAFFLVLRRRGNDDVITATNLVEVLPPSKRDDIRNLTKTRMVPRKTYLSGFLKGKYWGEMLVHHQAQYEHETFYDFHIYEAEVEIFASKSCHCIGLSKSICSGLHTEAEGNFHFKNSVIFPKERLPQLLPIILNQDGKEYKVNIHEAKLANVTFIAPLHQTNGQEVFGSIEAMITGYLLDFIEEEYSDPDFIEQATIPKPAPAVIASSYYHNGGSTRDNRHTSNRKYKYRRYVSNSGVDRFVHSIIGILVVVAWVAFLVTLIPQITFFLPFIIVPLLGRLIPLSAWRWIGNIIGFAVLLSFIMVIIDRFQNPHLSHPKLVFQNHTTTTQRNKTLVNDTTIVHLLSWQDYNGKIYTGKITIQRLALKTASQFKTSLQITNDNLNSYDEILYRLKEHDKNQLSGIYTLFDSIRSAEHLQVDKFAELMVSFVQQIPYAVVLPKDCNASLYSDQFIKRYLSTPDARCDGNERFGINTPIEFMATLKGDCDTRTLFLYTMLSHYKYDVLLLSSEYYNHSLIGINLPYEGIAFTQDSKHYVPWETTSAGIKPAILPDEISNLNYWRISLKSK